MKVLVRVCLAALGILALWLLTVQPAAAAGYVIDWEEAAVRQKCSDGSPVVARLPRGHAVRLRFAIAGSDSRCFSVSAQIEGRTVKGYLPKEALAGTDAFEKARQEAAVSQVLESATESVILRRPSRTRGPAKRPKRTAPAQGGLIGQPATDFALTDLSGRAFQLRGLQGKVVMLDFWASWCGPCRAELPSIQALHQELGRRGLVVLGVNGEPQQKAQDFVTSNRYTFPTLVDQGGKVARLYGVRGIPTVVVVDRSGTVASYLVGVHSKEQIRQELVLAGL